MQRQKGWFPDLPISRRRALRWLGSAAAAGLLTRRIPDWPADAAAADRRPPNIIFILCDNTQYDDLGFMGHPFIQTPGIDRLAAEGVVFENAFNTTSLCSPSRASILTGVYAHNHGVLNNHTPWTGQKTTFLELLKKTGYQTAFIGKWHMPGEGLPEMPFLDEFVSYTYREGQGSYFNCPLIVNGNEVPPRKEYLTEELTDRALEFIEQSVNMADGPRPFCLYLSHRAAHPPFIPPKDIRGMYDKEDVKMPDGVDSWFSKTNGNVFQGVMLGRYKNQYRRYCEVLTAMDRQIDRLVRKVDEMGLRDNTFLIFMADNGMLWGEHRCHGIKEPYEESIRVPMIVRAPGVTRDAGSRRPQMVLNIDLAATFLDLAGVPPPGDLDGQSLLPLLREPKNPGRDAFLLEYWKYYPENTPSYIGLRTKTHKYVTYEKGRPPQIFNILRDPSETHNLFETPAGKRLLPELRSKLDSLSGGRNPWD